MGDAWKKESHAGDLETKLSATTKRWLEGLGFKANCKASFAFNCSSLELNRTLKLPGSKVLAKGTIEMLFKTVST
jgi:hypothetical protein